MKVKDSPLFRTLGSMSLAIVLLVVLALASVVGTVLLQNQQQSDYLQQFGPLWYWVFRQLGLFDMYHANWFIALLGFIMVSLSVCLFRNTPRMMKNMRRGKVHISDKSLQHFHLYKQWEITKEQQQGFIEQMKERLLGWEIRQDEHEGRICLRADKGRYHAWGYIFTHAGLLVILIGGWMSVHYGFRGNMSVVEGGKEHTIEFPQGTSTARLDMPFEVRCNSFFIDFYPTGMPKEFRSNLTVIDNGKEVLTSDIIVNEPLYYKGVRIYQASFGDGGSAVSLRLFSLKPELAPQNVNSHIYQTWTDKKTGISMKFVGFSAFNVENMANPGEPKDFQNLGPAVEFELRGPNLKAARIKSFMNPFEINGSNQGSFLMVSTTGDVADYQPVSLGLDTSNSKDWQLFAAFTQHMQGIAASKAGREANLKAFKLALRDVYGDQLPDNIQESAMRVLQAYNILPLLPWPYIPMLTDYKQAYYTGLQLAQDPGMNIVWIGSAILVIGLCIMFYMPHRKLWLVLSPKDHGVQLQLGGVSNRNQLGFEYDFKEMLKQVMNSTNTKSNGEST